jgi:hypothetical protein
MRTKNRRIPLQNQKISMILSIIPFDKSKNVSCLSMYSSPNVTTIINLIITIFLPIHLYMRPISYRIGYQGETKY